MKQTIHQYFKAVSYLAITAFIAGILSACSGAYADPSQKTGVSDRAASASAVSGQAVSGSDGYGYSQYTYCSDQNLYYIRDCYSEEARLIERNLNDNSERSISVKGIHEICYADNDWVYYTKRTEWTEKKESDTIVGEVCRSPIDPDSFRMNEKKEEVLLKAENNVGFVLSRGHVGLDYRGVQCDGRYIVYEGGEWTGPEGVQSLVASLRVYDIQTGTYVQEELFAALSDYNDDAVLYGGSVFVYDEEEEALLRIRLEDGEKTTVVSYDQYKFDDVTEMHSGISTASGDTIFWINYGKKGQEIWQYNLTERKRVCLITDAQVQELLKQRGLLECSIGSSEHTFTYAACFFRAGRLYVQLEISGEGDGGEICENFVVVSKKAGAPDASLLYEEKLNGCLANPEARQKIFTKKCDGIYGRPTYKKKAYFKSRGLCVSMTEDECLMYMENEDEKKNMPAIYNFRMGSMRFLKKGEDWLSCYIPDRNNCIYTGDSGNYMESYDLCDSMPNNYDCLEKGE